MNTYADDAWRRITGSEPPKSFDQKTHEERIRDLNDFITLVNSGTDADDAAINELFDVIRANRITPEPSADFEDEVESA